MECGCYVLFLKDFFFCLLFSKLQEICNSRTCKRGCWPLFLKDVFLCCSFQNCSTQTLRNKSKYIRSSDEARGKCLISRTNRAWALSMRTSQKRGGLSTWANCVPFYYFITYREYACCHHGDQSSFCHRSHQRDFNDKDYRFAAIFPASLFIILSFIESMHAAVMPADL